eukprot:13053164-Alexandrium_andersonii.AAC.1
MFQVAAPDTSPSTSAPLICDKPLMSPRATEMSAFSELKAIDGLLVTARAAQGGMKSSDVGPVCCPHVT